MPTRRRLAAFVAPTLAAPVALAFGTPGTGAAATRESSALARSPELSTTTRLADRRSIPWTDVQDFFGQLEQADRGHPSQHRDLTCVVVTWRGSPGAHPV